jgi:hypothetical protein
VRPSVVFSKVGKHVVGYYGDIATLVAFEGELRANVIVATEALKMELDIRSAEVTGFRQIAPSDRKRYTEMPLSSAISRFPSPMSSKYIREREQRWLSACQRHFDAK